MEEREALPTSAPYRGDAQTLRRGTGVRALCERMQILMLHLQGDT
jgi:hypothetical protein